MSTSSPVERTLRSNNGYAMAGMALAGVLAIVAMFLTRAIASPAGITATVLLVVAVVLLFAGLYMLQPNESAILLLFGEYRGTDRSAGLRWVNPF